MSIMPPDCSTSNARVTSTPDLKPDRGRFRGEGGGSGGRQRRGGNGAVATASGMAALWLAVSTIGCAGDHVVCSRNVYGGTNNLLTQTLPRFGIDTTFVGARDIDGYQAAFRDNTKLVIAETLGNPGLEVLDLPLWSQIAHDEGVPVLIDNTFASPYLFRPFDWGANLAVPLCDKVHRRSRDRGRRGSGRR